MGTAVTSRPDGLLRRIFDLLSALMGIHRPCTELPRYDVSDTLADIEGTINEIRRTATPAPLSDA